MRVRSFYDELHKLLFGSYPRPVTKAEWIQYELDRVDAMSLKERVDFMADLHGADIYKQMDEIMAGNEDVRLEYEKG